jgi:hypothetical protein
MKTNKGSIRNKAKVLKALFMGDKAAAQRLLEEDKPHKVVVVHKHLDKVEYEGRQFTLSEWAEFERKKGLTKYNIIKICIVPGNSSRLKGENPSFNPKDLDEI